MNAPIRAEALGLPERLHPALLVWPGLPDDALGLALWDERRLAAATDGVANGAFTCGGVATDSREIQPGDLFVALKGAQMDGHTHIGDAMARGASAVLASAEVDVPHVRVADTSAALVALGAAARARLAPEARVIAVTGSAGKTGVKEAIYAALDRSSRGRAHRSVKSYNNHVGVPLSLARMPARTRYGVFELGMNHAGEIAALTRQVRPHVAVITTIAPAHIENFASEEGIADAKAEVVEGLMPGGIVILPADNRHFPRLAAAARAHGAEVRGFGSADTAWARLIDVVPAPGGGSLVTAALGARKLCYTVAQAGHHHVLNSLAVMAAVAAVEGDLGAAGLALADMRGLAGRGARHQVPARGGDGSGRALVIDESYNANPASMAATLAEFGVVPAQRRIAVLGAMYELGAESARYHRDLAEPVRSAGISHVVLVGEGMAPLAEQLGKKGSAALVATPRVDHVPNAAAALTLLAGEAISGGDAVLIKGSNATGLGAVVSALCAREG